MRYLFLLHSSVQTFLFQFTHFQKFLLHFPSPNTPFPFWLQNLTILLQEVKIKYKLNKMAFLDPNLSSDTQMLSKEDTDFTDMNEADDGTSQEGIQRYLTICN